jgi:hypothetical protein
MKKSALKLLVFIRLESNPLKRCVAHAEAAALPSAARRLTGRELPTRTLNANHSQYWAEFIIDRQGKQIRTHAKPCGNRVLRRF